VTLVHNAKLSMERLVDVASSLVAVDHCASGGKSDFATQTVEHCGE